MCVKSVKITNKKEHKIIYLFFLIIYIPKNVTIGLSNIRKNNNRKINVLTYNISTFRLLFLFKFYLHYCY